MMLLQMLEGSPLELPLWMSEGLPLGSLEGSPLRLPLRTLKGSSLGLLEQSPLRLPLGTLEGFPLGLQLGMLEGFLIGSLEGSPHGLLLKNLLSNLIEGMRCSIRCKSKSEVGMRPLSFHSPHSKSLKQQVHFKFSICLSPLSCSAIHIQTRWCVCDQREVCPRNCWSKRGSVVGVDHCHNVDAFVVIHGHGDYPASNDFPHPSLNDRVPRCRRSNPSFACGARGRRCWRHCAAIVIIIVTVVVVMRCYVSGNEVTKRCRGGDRH